LHADRLTGSRVALFLDLPLLLVYTYTMLSALFNPQSIAVIGASADLKKVGHAVLKNLLQYNYPGRLIPINP
jgi:predicted CoA-binding protein